MEGIRTTERERESSRTDPASLRAFHTRMYVVGARARAGGRQDALKGFSQHVGSFWEERQAQLAAAPSGGVAPPALLPPPPAKS